MGGGHMVWFSDTSAQCGYKEPLPTPNFPGKPDKDKDGGLPDSDPGSGCNSQDKTYNARCLGEILNYRPTECGMPLNRGICADAHAISINFAAGFGHQYYIFGFDLVWTDQGVVLFIVEPAYFDVADYYSGTQNDTHLGTVTPQFGGSLTLNAITSILIRLDPSPEGIRNAWGGYAMQEGFTAFMITANASSSTDADGTPNYETTSSGQGVSVGIPDIIFEYHRYTTITRPVDLWYTELKDFLGY